MRNLLFPGLIAVALAGTVYAMSRAPDHKADEEAALKLPVTAGQVSHITPYLHAAAKDLGHSRVRGYEGSVFVDLGGDTISFFREKGELTMHVGLETKYRHAKKERTAAVKELQEKGQSIYEHALSLKARAEAREQVASTGERPPAG
jgi:hypothetical protein